MSARRMRGAALVLVLWLIVLLSSLIGAFALTARVEQLQGSSGVDMARGGELARAGIEYGLYRLAGTPDRPAWVPDGRSYQWQYAGVPIQITLTAESGKVDLNQADAVLLTALLQQGGAEQALAQRLAAAIMDWRDSDDLLQPGGAEAAQYQAAGLPYAPANNYFLSIAELRRVLGMTPELFDAVAPWLTIWSQRSLPEALYAADPVLRAMGQDPALVHAQRQAMVASGGGGPLASGTDSFSIQSRAQLGDGRVVSVDAVLRTGPSEVAGSTYTMLRWQQGMGRQ